MELLCGWKEIAEHLHLTVRTAQRWETVGLPVRRAYESQRSPVLASRDELEQWVSTRQTRNGERACESHHLLVSELKQLQSAHRRARRKMQRLLSQVSHLGSEQQRLLSLIKASLISTRPSADALRVQSPL